MRRRLLQFVFTSSSEGLQQAVLPPLGEGVYEVR